MTVDVEDAVERTARNGYLVAADFMVAIHHAESVTDLLRIRTEIDAVVTALDRMSCAALAKANRQCGGKR